MADPIATVAPRFVGQSIKRKENRRFLTGRGQYVDDTVIPGMLHAAILRSPVARARMVSIDTSAALELPGVVEIYLAADINGMFGTLAYYPWPTEPFGVDMVLADGVVSFVGDPIAVVLAESRYIAEDALELIDIDYDVLDPVVTPEQAEQAEPCLPGTTTNLASIFEAELPGVEEALSQNRVVRCRIRQPRVMPTPMEARGIIADPRMPGRLELHMTSQNPHQARGYMAQVMGMNENHIRIITGDVGGGFGQKYSCGRDYLAAIAAARLCGRPVKWIEDRAEAMIAGGFGRKERLTLDLAFDSDGMMKASRLEYNDNCGSEVSSSGGAGQMMCLFHTNAYTIPLVSTRARSWFTNTGPTIAYRGPWAGETLIREATIEQAARELGIDCIELRRRNIIRQWPHMLPLGIPMDNLTPLECLDLAVEKVGYDRFRQEQAAAREQGRYLGIGFSLCIEPTALSMKESETESCSVRIGQSGKVTATVSCTSQGHSIETTRAQVIADELGVDVDDVTIEYGDTAAVAFGMSAGGSRQAVVGGGAAKMAAGTLREKVLRIAGHFLQAPVEELTIASGKVIRSGPVASEISLEEIAQAAYTAPSTMPSGTDMGLSADSSYATGGPTFANAAHACVVEVDITTGIVKLLRYVVAEDCGVLLNPAVVEGQVAGGIIQALGNVLWETQPYDENGTPGATTFKDYSLPLANDIPMIEFHHLCSPSQTPTGAKGVGEGGAIVGAPAVYNAVMDALSPFGVWIEQLPLSPSRIVTAIHESKAARAG